MPLPFKGQERDGLRLDIRLFTFLILILSVFLAESPAAQQNTNWTECSVNWRATGSFALDLSPFLKAPAGKHGPIRAKDGHFFTGDGERFRIWGFNLTGSTCFPEKSDAPMFAEFIARRGINSIRFHYLDSNWGNNATLFDPDLDHTQALQASQLDKLDFFVAELKKRGVYSNFNLNVGRHFRKGDEVKDFELLGLGKTVSYFDERIQKLHAEFARQLLTHVNPYTGLAYIEEPALMIVELVNENSIVESWVKGRTQGQLTEPSRSIWRDIPPSYAEKLTQHYNEWLMTQLNPKELKRLRQECQIQPHESVPRLAPWQFSKASNLRFQTEARFYIHLELQYFNRMYRFLKDELKCQALVVGSSDHNHHMSGLPHLKSTSQMDVVDSHVYWQHPAGNWMEDIQNSAMVNEPLKSTVVQLSRSKVVGKPFIVSETNHPAPSDYATEGIPILAAYAQFLDWDGIYFYTLSHGSPKEWDTRHPMQFDMGPDPVKMTNFSAAAYMFYRQDLKIAERTHRLKYTNEQVLESLRLEDHHFPFYSPGLDPAIPLVHGLEIANFASKTPVAHPKLTNTDRNRLLSDTGELAWVTNTESTMGYITVNTPKTQILCGYIGKENASLDNLAVNLESAFCSIIISSQDNLPLKSSSSILVAATSKSAPQNMKWKDQTLRKTLIHWGALPMQMKALQGTITLKNLEKGRAFQVTAMDANGMTLGHHIETQENTDGLSFKLGHPATVCYQVKRSETFN